MKYRPLYTEQGSREVHRDAYIVSGTAGRQHPPHDTRGELGEPHLPDGARASGWTT